MLGDCSFRNFHKCIVHRVALALPKVSFIVRFSCYHGWPGLSSRCHSGTIKFYTHPPEQTSLSTHVSAEIVSTWAKEFNVVCCTNNTKWNLFCHSDDAIFPLSAFVYCWIPWRMWILQAKWRFSLLLKSRQTHIAALEFSMFVNSHRSGCNAMLHIQHISHSRGRLNGYTSLKSKTFDYFGADNESMFSEKFHWSKPSDSCGCVRSGTNDWRLHMRVFFFLHSHLWRKVTVHLCSVSRDFAKSRMKVPVISSVLKTGLVLGNCPLLA